MDDGKKAMRKVNGKRKELGKNSFGYVLKP